MEQLLQKNEAALEEAVSKTENLNRENAGLCARVDYLANERAHLNIKNLAVLRQYRIKTEALEAMEA